MSKLSKADKIAIYREKDQIKPSIDKIGLILFFIIFFVVGWLFYSVFYNYVSQAKEYSEQGKVYVCDELNKTNSPYVKVIGDKAYIQGKPYNLNELRINCAMKSQNGSIQS